MIELRDVLAANPDAELVGPRDVSRSFTGFAFDSRTTAIGQLFLALRTARADGHDYVENARQAGAYGAIVERAVAVDGALVQVVVPNVEIALQRYAAFRMATQPLHVVGVTGSVGKTSTKEAIAQALAVRLAVHRSPGNFTGLLGLPIAIGEIGAEHDVSVLEMATGHPGELERTLAIAPVDVGVLTAITPIHLRSFGDVDALTREFAHMAAAVRTDGRLIIDSADARVRAVARETDAPVVTCAIGESADYTAHSISVAAEGTRAVIESPTGTHRIVIPWVGSHFLMAALHALAVGAVFGVDEAAAIEALSLLPALPGRLRARRSDTGALVLDDTFSSSPASVAAALHTLRDIDAKRRILVLGDMDDLGADEVLFHEHAGRDAANCCDVVITLGAIAARAADAAVRSGMLAAATARTFVPVQATVAIAAHAEAGDVVLVKAGVAVAGEQVVEALLANSTDATRAQDRVRADRSTDHISVTQTRRPTWLEIDVEVIAANIRELSRVASPARLMVVLKGDAYGHGADLVAHTAIQSGVDLLGVAMVSEAEALRASGVSCEILVLSPTPPWQARRGVRTGASFTVFDLEMIDAIGRAAGELDIPTRVHVKVDTGMHRLGASPESARALVERAQRFPHLEVAGVYSHLARADAGDAESRAATLVQQRRFDTLVADLTAAGLRPPSAHLANTSALVIQSLEPYDIVRCGLAVYGYLEGRATGDASMGVDLRPALTWKSMIAQVRDLAAGEAVGYGGTWTTARASRIATIPVGYGDGFRRGPQPWHHVLVRGSIAPVVGRVSMDQSTIDVTDIPDARPGDEVVLIGAQGEQSLWAGEVAGWLGTNEYEVLTAILPRVPRIPRRSTGP